METSRYERTQVVYGMTTGEALQPAAIQAAVNATLDELARQGTTITSVVIQPMQILKPSPVLQGQMHAVNAVLVQIVYTESVANTDGLPHDDDVDTVTPVTTSDEGATVHSILDRRGAKLNA